MHSFLIYFLTYISFFSVAVGRCGRIMIWGHIVKHFGVSCVRTLYFICKSTEFHDMWMDCQRILVSFLLIISHKLLAIAKRCPLPSSLPDLRSPINIAIYTHWVVYIKRRW